MLGKMTMPLKCTWTILKILYFTGTCIPYIVSTHRRILGMASVVCVLVKVCVSSISLYKLDPDNSTSIYPSMHSFRLQNRSLLSLQFMLEITVLF